MTVCPTYVRMELLVWTKLMGSSASVPLDIMEPSAMTVRYVIYFCFLLVYYM